MQIDLATINDKLKAAEFLANYITSNQSEYDDYKEYIATGGNPKDSILYKCAVILDRTHLYKEDVEAYEYYLFQQKGE